MRTIEPTCLALAAVVPLLTSGCYPACGDYSALTGLEMVIGEDVYDFDRDDMFESCGSGFGAFGIFAMDVDAGMGSMTLLPNHRDMKIDTHICTALYYNLLFDNQTLVPGQELTIYEGEAGIYAVQAVPLTQGTVQVLDSREADEECAPFREQDYKLSWDLEYSDNTGHLYTAQGKDWVGFSLPMSSTDEGC
jgi:hypothetical protein